MVICNLIETEDSIATSMQSTALPETGRQGGQRWARSLERGIPIAVAVWHWHRKAVSHADMASQ